MSPLPDFINAILQQAEQAEPLESIGVDTLTIDAWPPEPGHLEWLKQYLSPLAHSGKSGDHENQRWKIGSFFAADIISAMAILLESGRVDWFEVWNGKCHLQRVFFSPALVVDFDREYGHLCCYDLDQHRITLVTSAHTPDPLHELGRLMRDVMTEYLRADGWELFHAGAVRIDGRTILLPGNSGAGKTSLVVALLHAGADYIANDRVFLKPTADGVLLRAFPMAIAMGLGTAMQYPQLKHHILEPWSLAYPRRRLLPEQVAQNPEQAWEKLPDKLQFFPQELTRLMGMRDVVADGRVDAVVFPRIHDLQGTQLHPADPEEARRILVDNVLDPSRGGLTAPWRPLNFPRPQQPSHQHSIDRLLQCPLVQFNFLASRNLLNDVRRYGDYLLGALDEMALAKTG